MNSLVEAPVKWRHWSAGVRTGPGRKARCLLGRQPCDPWSGDVKMHREHRSHTVGYRWTEGYWERTLEKQTGPDSE